MPSWAYSWGTHMKVRHLILVLASLCFGANAHAADVRSFDFRGIKMGMALDDVQELVGGAVLTKKDTKYGFVKGHELTVKEEDDAGSINMRLAFDAEGRVYQINSTQYINERRNLRKLFDVIFAKYGVDPATEKGKIIDDKSTRENRKWVQDKCNCAEMIIDTEVLRSQERTRITVVMIDTDIRTENDKANRTRFLDLEAASVDTLKGGEGVKL